MLAELGVERARVRDEAARERHVVGRRVFACSLVSLELQSRSERRFRPPSRRVMVRASAEGPKRPQTRSGAARLIFRQLI